MIQRLIKAVSFVLWSIILVAIVASMPYWVVMLLLLILAGFGVVWIITGKFYIDNIVDFLADKFEKIG